MMISVSVPMRRIEIDHYLNQYLLDKFSVLEGVASVDISWNQEKSMRIWFNRDQLAVHNITFADVEEAESESMEFPITINHQYTTP